MLSLSLSLSLLHATQNGDALASASDALRSDLGVVAAAVASVGPAALCWAGASLRSPEAFASAVDAALLAYRAFAGAFLLGTLSQTLGRSPAAVAAGTPAKTGAADDEEKSCGGEDAVAGTAAGTSAGFVHCGAKRRQLPSTRCLLEFLSLGDETGTFVKRHVAGFAGVPTGQLLRDLRVAKIRLATAAAARRGSWLRLCEAVQRGEELGHALPGEDNREHAAGENDGGNANEGEQDDDEEAAWAWAGIGLPASL